MLIKNIKKRKKRKIYENQPQNSGDALIFTAITFALMIINKNQGAKYKLHD